MFKLFVLSALLAVAVAKPSSFIYPYGRVPYNFYDDGQYHGEIYGDDGQYHEGKGYLPYAAPYAAPYVAPYVTPYVAPVAPVAPLPHVDHHLAYSASYPYSYYPYGKTAYPLSASGADVAVHGSNNGFSYGYNTYRSPYVDYAPHYYY